MEHGISIAHLDALAIMRALVAEYPGLVDGETAVNGADLVETLTRQLYNNAELVKHLTKDTK